MNHWYLIFILLFLGIVSAFVSNNNVVAIKHIGNGLHFAFLRFLFTLITMILIGIVWYLLTRKDHPKVESKVWKLSAFSGVSGAIIGIALFTILQQVDSAAILSALYTPIVMISTIVVGSIWFEDKFTKVQMIGLGLSILSVIILTMSTKAF